MMMVGWLAQAKLREELSSVTLPRWLRLLEAKMADNGPGPFCTGDKVRRGGGGAHAGDVADGGLSVCLVGGR